MPKEILDGQRATQILGSLSGGLKCIDCNVVLNHTEIVYEIKETVASKPLCDSCGEPGAYIQHTIDHMGQNYLAIICKPCSPPGYSRLVELRSGD